MSEAARAQLEKDIERMNVEGQRFQQDAQAEINELSQQLQSEFQQKLFPVLDQLIKEHDLHVLLSATDAGVVAANPGVDLTLEAVKKLDAIAQAAKPAAPAAAAPRPPRLPRLPRPSRRVRTRRRRTRNLGRNVSLTCDVLRSTLSAP